MALIFWCLLVYLTSCIRSELQQEDEVITPQKIDEWIREIEERPSSGLIIIRYIANRLSDLTKRNEELLAENIQLRTGKKTEEYEARIANLEYQLDLLKRQLGGELADLSAGAPPAETLSVFVYTATGEVLRLELDPAGRESRQLLAKIPAPPPPEGDAPVHVYEPRLLCTGSHEELLFLFDSGRIVTAAASSIPSGVLDWKRAYLQEPRGAEELVAIVPIGRMSLADSIVQSSRRGCVKKMMRTAFEGHVSKGFAGTGVKLATDRTCGLTLCAKDDRFAIASLEGWLLTLETGRISYAIEESLRLSTTDHIVSSFAVGSRKTVIFVTENGKVIQREVGWMEAAASQKSRGQAVFSEERRKAGIRLVAAAAVDASDWCAALDTSGTLCLYAASDLLGAGSLTTSEGASVAAFGVF
jgi:DNA gyrase/topoisomerase IV subunit A